MTGEKHTKGKKARLRRAFSQLRWMQLGQAQPAKHISEIKESILKFDISVTRIAISDVLAPLKLYGIEAQYENADAIVYLVEDGNEPMMIAFSIRKKPQGSRTPIPTA
ncbi:MAG: hypothetical protein ACXQTL_00610 [Methanosarcinales archaeon]